ncbi:hypothetical protein A7M48_21940 [Acinetobacter baumannii]|nr:hypothetical protein A7M48_21940 [Acinetobacter baumannii]
MPASAALWQKCTTKIVCAFRMQMAKHSRGEDKTETEIVTSARNKEKKKKKRKKREKQITKASERAWQ